MKTTHCLGGPSTLFRSVLLISVMPSVVVSVIGSRDARRADEVHTAPEEGRSWRLWPNEWVSSLDRAIIHRMSLMTGGKGRRWISLEDQVTGSLVSCPGPIPSPPFFLCGVCMCMCMLVSADVQVPVYRSQRTYLQSSFSFSGICLFQELSWVEVRVCGKHTLTLWAITTTSGPF